MARTTWTSPATAGLIGGCVLAAVVVGGAPGCRAVAVPPGSEDPDARATLAGTVRGPGGVAPVSGRQVQAVDSETGRRHTTQTNGTGGFSFLLPPGRYRLEVVLGPGETVIEEPGEITLDASGLAAAQNVVLGGAGVVEDS